LIFCYRNALLLPNIVGSALNSIELHCIISIGHFFWTSS